MGIKYFPPNSKGGAKVDETNEKTRVSGDFSGEFSNKTRKHLGRGAFPKFIGDETRHLTFGL